MFIIEEISDDIIKYLEECNGKQKLRFVKQHLIEKNNGNYYKKDNPKEFDKCFIKALVSLKKKNILRNTFSTYSKKNNNKNLYLSKSQGQYSIEKGNSNLPRLHKSKIKKVKSIIKKSNKKPNKEKFSDIAGLTKVSKKTIDRVMRALNAGMSVKKASIEFKLKPNVIKKIRYSKSDSFSFSSFKSLSKKSLDKKKMLILALKDKNLKTKEIINKTGFEARLVRSVIKQNSAEMDKKIIDIYKGNKRKFSPKDISSNFGIDVNDIEKAVNQFVVSKKGDYSQRKFSQIHNMIKENIPKSKISNELNVDTFIIEDVEKKISKFFKHSQKSKKEISEINAVLRLYAKGKTVNQIRKKTKLKTNQIINIKNESITTIKGLLLEKLSVNYISNLTGFAKDIVKAVKENKINKEESSSKVSTKINKYPDYYYDIKEMVHREYSTQDIADICLKSRDRVMHVMKVLREKEGLFIPYFYNLRQSKLTQAEIDIRRDTISKNHEKSNREIAKIIGISPNALRLWKEIYYHD